MCVRTLGGPFELPPPPPLHKHGLVPAPEWAGDRCFQDCWGPLVFVVPNAGLGVCDALVEGRGSSMFAIVHSVHNNIVPQIATPCSLFGCDVRPWLKLPFPARLSCTALCWPVCCAHAPACLDFGAAAVRRGGGYVHRGFAALRPVVLSWCLVIVQGDDHRRFMAKQHLAPPSPSPAGQHSPPPPPSPKQEREGKGSE